MPVQPAPAASRPHICRTWPTARPNRYRELRRRPDPWPPVPKQPLRAAFRREATWRADVDQLPRLQIPGYRPRRIRIAVGYEQLVVIGTGDGNGFVQCSAGHRHWGRFGAAGLLLTDGPRVLLQHRAAWTHEGDTWAVPGGARDSHENAIAAALREVAEETSLDPASVDPYTEWIDDHGGWAYTTILARMADRSDPDVRSTNAESTEVRWWPLDEVAGLRLHYGFANAWPSLRELMTDTP